MIAETAASQSAPARSFGVHAFGCNLRLAASSAEAHAMLEQYVFPSLPRTASTGTPDISIRVDRIASGFQLSVDDAAMASAAQPVDLVPDLIRALDDAVIQRLTTLRAVHAGTVLWEGRALLLPGMSHAGKSSLVSHLLRRGAVYLSDEYALIDSQGYVHPYPRPLLVRNGCTEQFPVLAGEYNASVGETPAPVGCIFALRYHSTGGWNIKPITQGEALLTLLRNTPHVLAESPNLVETFQRAVSGAACYVGTRGEAAHAADRILQLMSSTT